MKLNKYERRIVPKINNGEVYDMQLFYGTTSAPKSH